MKDQLKKIKKAFPWIMNPPKKPLSAGVEVKRVMVGPDGEEAMIMQVRHNLGLRMLTTVIIYGGTFEVEVRSPRTFDMFFQKWKWK